MRAARETCTWTIVRPGRKKVWEPLPQAIGIHLLSEKAICSGTLGVCAASIETLYNCVSTKLRCLGLKWLKLLLCLNWHDKTRENEKLSWGSSTGLIVNLVLGGWNPPKNGTPHGALIKQSAPLIMGYIAYTRLGKCTILALPLIIERVPGCSLRWKFWWFEGLVVLEFFKFFRVCSAFLSC